MGSEEVTRTVLLKSRAGRSGVRDRWVEPELLRERGGRSRTAFGFGANAKSLSFSGTKN